MTIRLDKYMTDMGIGSRSEIKNYIRKGRVLVNNQIVKNSDLKISLDSDNIIFDGQPVIYRLYEYYMLNKPKDVVSAVSDSYSKTVIDLINTKKRKDLFPVGRLDKDTEGLLLITNDGLLSHQLLSPKKHISKVYFAKIAECVTIEDIEAFKDGVYIDDYKTLPGELKILKSGDISEIQLTIFEGKFHQVKRMFEAVGKQVIYLKRIAMGELLLDENLKPGEYRELTEQELLLLKK